MSDRCLVGINVGRVVNHGQSLGGRETYLGFLQLLSLLFAELTCRGGHPGELPFLLRTTIETIIFLDVFSVLKFVAGVAVLKGIGRWTVVNAVVVISVVFAVIIIF